MDNNNAILAAVGVIIIVLVVYLIDIYLNFRYKGENSDLAKELKAQKLATAREAKEALSYKELYTNLLNHRENDKQKPEESDEEEFDVEFDFKTEDLRIVSIERSFNSKNQRVTIIGYLNGDGPLHEWYLYCSKEKHKALVDRFRESKGLPSKYKT